MTTLHIGNNRTTEMAGDLTGLAHEERVFASCAAQRALWFAEDGDVFVLPQEPDASFVGYVTGITGTDPASLRFVVPPAGYAGPYLLTEDRVAGAQTRAAVRAALSGRPVDRVLAYYPDASVARLAHALGADTAMPGHAFFAQGGSSVANSKAAFRAMATGIGIPIAPGTVAANRQEAHDAITELLDAGHPVIVKKEFHSGSNGNEILSPTAGVTPYGAPQAVVVPDAAAAEDYLKRRWDWLTDDGTHRLVIERYFTDARAVYAEFLVGDRGIEYTGQGELLMAPVFDGVAIPVPDLAPDEVGTLVNHTRRLCEAFHAFGYRGTMSVDGFLTTDGELLLNETNSRISGSTHLHDIVARRVIGIGAGRRVMYERGAWAAPSFDAAVRALAGSGLAYDPLTRTGIILTCDFIAVDGTVRHCAVAEDIDRARELEHALLDLRV